MMEALLSTSEIPRGGLIAITSTTVCGVDSRLYANTSSDSCMIVEAYATLFLPNLLSIGTAKPKSSGSAIK